MQGVKDVIGPDNVTQVMTLQIRQKRCPLRYQELNPSAQKFLLHIPDDTCHRVVNAGYRTRIQDQIFNPQGWCLD